MSSLVPEQGMSSPQLSQTSFTFEPWQTGHGRFRFFGSVPFPPQ